jgi:hypothetical protein
VDYPQVFRAVLANASMSETETSFDLITDLESLNALVASRSLSAKNPWAYKNERECTSLSAELTCTKTLLACIRHGKHHEFGGWEFFEDPADYTPGSGGNTGGGIGQGTGGGGQSSCFSLDTLIYTTRGDVPFGDFPVGKTREKIEICSFNPRTEAVEIDEACEVFEHEVVGY